MTRLSFLALLATAKPGEMISYHLGNLMRDRKIGAQFMTVGAVAQAAWEAYEDKRVALVQRRAGPDKFDYIAVKL